MARRTNPRTSQSNVMGRGKVTPIQVAFIVDQYLAYNDFARSRAVFRSEASSLLGNSKSQGPKNLLSLGEILNEYVCLKGQRVEMDQNLFQFELRKCELEKERAKVDEARSQVEQEKAKLDSFLEEFKGLVDGYKSSTARGCLTPPPSNTAIVCSAAPESKALPSSDNTAIRTPITAPASMAPNHNTRKRRIYKSVPNNPEPNKKACGSTSAGLSTSPGNTSTGQQQHENLLTQSSSGSPYSSTACLKTPQRPVPYSCGKSISPPENLSSSEMTPNNCATYSSQKIIVSSPTKRFSIERKHCTYTSPSKSNMNKRDHVKSRLDFDAADLPNTSEKFGLDVCTTSESYMDEDLLDLDLDALSPDFFLSDLLSDVGNDWEVGQPCQDAIGASPSELCEDDFCVSQELEQSIPKGSSDQVSSVKSITQCIEAASPEKKGKRSLF